MTQSSLPLAVAYYTAMSQKDLAGMARYLHPNVQLIGPLGNLSGKEAVLDAGKRLFDLATGTQIRATFDSGDLAMLAYDMIFPEPIGKCRTAVLMKFEEGLIARIELFLDARPFEKSQR